MLVELFYHEMIRNINDDSEKQDIEIEKSFYFTINEKDKATIKSYVSEYKDIKNYNYSPEDLLKFLKGKGYEASALCPGISIDFN